MILSWDTGHVQNRPVAVKRHLGNAPLERSPSSLNATRRAESLACSWPRGLRSLRSDVRDHDRRSAMNARATSTLVLWHFPVSHFNEKVRWALDLRALFPAFSAFYKLRHRINPTTISEAPTRVRAALDRIT